MAEQSKNKKISTDNLGVNNLASSRAAEEARDKSLAPKQKPTPEETQQKYRAVKTYKDYAAESLRKGGGSLTKMIIAERQKEREKNRVSIKSGKNVALTFLSIVFVLLGIVVVGAVIYLVAFKVQDIDAPVVITPEPLIVYDYRKEIYVESPSRTKWLREVEKTIENTGIEVGAVRFVFFVTNDQEGRKTLVNTSDFLGDLRVKASSKLLRSFEENFMYGIYSSTNNAPFLILRTTSFDTAFSEMLAWERTMGPDLQELFSSEHDFTRETFVDIVLYNKDVRAVLSQSGEVVLGYSFIDKNTIVIFENKLALKEVINRSQRNTVKQ